MTQSSQAGVSVGIMDEGEDSLIGDNGLFTITSSFDWEESDESIDDTNPNPCQCSVNYFAGFYDADGYGLMYMGGEHPGNVITAPGLYPEAKHGFLLGYYYQGTSNFGLFVDATSPTTLRNFGTAKYASRIVGFMTGLDSSGHVQMDGWTTMTVSWGDRPSLSGKVSTLYGSKVTVENGMTMKLANHYTLATELTFHGTDWSDEHKSFHNGNIDCASSCEFTNESTSSWGAMLVDSGSGGVDPFRLVGTFGLYQYELAGITVDWIGFLYGQTPLDIEELDWGLTAKPRALGRALVRHVGVEVSDKLSYAEESNYLASADPHSLNLVVRDAATINTTDYWDSGDLALFVDYSQGRPNVAKPHLGFELDHVIPPAIVGGDPLLILPLSGSATYSGNAGGFYTSSGGASGGFVSTIDIGVSFGSLQPIMNGTMGYDLGGVTGKLALSGATWRSSISSFEHGTLGCDSGCQTAGTIASWSAQLIDVTGTGSALPEGVIGKFGAAGLRQQGSDQVFTLYGIFAGAGDVPAPLWPAISTFFPATPHGMLADPAGMYHRKTLNSGRLFHRRGGTDIATTVSVVKMNPGGNFVHADGKIQLASNLWDWRTDDYANCYCTMFLTGAAYGSDGNEIMGGLSSNPKQQRNASIYADAKHGWVGGMWRLDLLPAEWSTYRGKTQIGIFVDGTAPVSFPTTGSASYLGYGTGYAMPHTSTLASEIEVIQNKVSIHVNWASGTPPSVSGVLSLGGLYGNTTVSTNFRLTLGEAQWSAADRKFHTGSIDCSANGLCYDRSDTTGYWEGLFVETESGQTSPGLFAAAYAMSKVSIGYYNTSLSRLEPRGVWDMFGWFSAQPALEITRRNELLRLPSRAVMGAIQEGFDEIYYNSSDGQRQDALHAAGQATIDHASSDSRAAEFGYAKSNSNYTGFWTYTTSNDVTLGVYASGHYANHRPTSGGATYIGNAFGFYKSTAGEEGVMSGDVSLYMAFNGSDVTATGTMSFDMGGKTGSFTMQDTFSSRVKDGHLNCATGCQPGSGTGVWAGNFVETERDRPRNANSTPGGFLGSFGVDGVAIDGDFYDALGMFAAARPPR